MKAKQFFLIISLLVWLTPFSANAYDVKIDGIYYSLESTFNYDTYNYDLIATVVSGETSYSGDVNIPNNIWVNDYGSEYYGKRFDVMNIGQSAFEGCTGLTSVTIPGSVTVIGEAAFRGCSSLTSIIIPNSVTTIGDEAFGNCLSLTSITIPNSVNTIGVGAFHGTAWYNNQPEDGLVYVGNVAYCYKCYNGYMPNGTQITIKDGTSGITGYAFYKCSGLTSITIPNSVTSIGTNAFYGCRGLTSVTIPNSVTMIGRNAFDGCSGLGAVFITDLAAWCNIVFNEAYSNPLYYAHRLFLNSQEIKNLIIPDGVTRIGAYAFCNCSQLTSITIPNSVSYIANYAFSGCNSLTDVWCYAERANIDNFSFSNIASATLHVPEASIESYSGTPWSNFGTIVAIGNEIIIFADANVKALCVANWDTNGDGELSEAEAAAVTDLGEVFKGKTTITSFNELQYFTGLTSVAASAFRNCSNLTSVTIPENVTSIGSQAFSGSSSLTSVESKIQDPFTFCSNAFSGISSNCMLIVPNETRDAYIAAEWTENVFKGGIVETSSLAIAFADFNVKALCVANWDTNDDGELSKAEAAAVTNLGEVFKDNKTILFFNELQYFTRLTSINEHAFDYCSNLTSVTIPETVTSINQYAFSDCSGLTSITIPEGVTCIGYRAFDRCRGLTSITIPNNVTTIEAYAFLGCSGLTSLTIGNSVANICDRRSGISSNDVFLGCSSLTSIIVDSDNTIYDSRNNCNAIIETATNTLIVGCMNTVIPESVTDIGDEAFQGSDGLTSIIVPNSVVKIGGNPFGGCDGLTSIIVDNGNPIYDSRNNCNAIIETATNTLIAGCMNTTIPESVTKIGDNAFTGCSGLTDITIPEGVTSIGYGALSGTSWLRNQPDGVVYAGNVAYGYKGNRPSGTLTFKDGTLGITEQAFQYCDGLTSITIPNSVKNIGVRAFSGCRNLSSVIIGSGVTEIGRDAFEGTAWYNNQPGGLVYAGNVAYKYKGTMPSGTEIILNEGTLGIAGAAFQNCTGLTSIIVPNSVVSFGDEAFDNCNMTSINIPEGVTKIGYSVFWGCTKLTSVTIPNSVKVIGEAAFWNCKSMTSLTIPVGVADIGWCAFQYCSGLTSIIIPNSVKRIDEYAFLYCSSLTDVWCYSNTPPVAHSKAYYESPIGSATLHVPAGCKAAYKLADCWKEFGSIVEFIEGDVNSDGETDVVDVVDIARFVVGTPAETFVEILADINYDGSVNIGDAVALVNEIAGDQNFVKAKRAPSRTAESEDALSLTLTDEGLALVLANQRDYTAFQFDLFVPEGTDVARMLLNAERKQKHQLLYNKVEEGHYRVAALSTSNRTFQGNDGELLNFTLEGVASGDVTIRDIHFFDTEGGDYMFCDLQSSSATEISSLKEEQTTTRPHGIYDLQGRKVETMSHGIYIVNGKKVIIK